MRVRVRVRARARARARVRGRVRGRARARVGVRVGVGVRVRVRVRAAWLTPPAPLRGAALVPQGAQRSVEGVGDVARGEYGEGGLGHGEGATWVG